MEAAGLVPPVPVVPEFVGMGMGVGKEEAAKGEAEQRSPVRNTVFYGFYDDIVNY